MKQNSIVVGMGIGNLYKSVLENLGYNVVTVDSDPSKGAEFTDIAEAIMQYGYFDTAHVCTPNFTHAELANILGDCSRVVFVEKPGLENAEEWGRLIATNQHTRIMMVKNNMWRENINELRELASKAKSVRFNWINKDRIPSPGTWFTTRELAFGGVSRDLMPHLLSLYIALNPDWEKEKVNGKGSIMKWELSQLTSTDYGTVKSDGTYNVDDFCHINFGNKWHLTADWRSLTEDKRDIEFVMEDNSVVTFELGLCPEEAYQSMIKDAVSNYNNIDYWFTQLKHDLWIHAMMGKL